MSGPASEQRVAPVAPGPSAGETGSTMSERDHISRGEIRKDAIQESVEATITAAGQVGSAVTGAVREVARTVGGLATELFEIQEAARRAGREHSEDR